MKQKINIRLGLVALVALALTTLGVTTVYYNLFQQQVRRDLRVTAEMLSASAVFEDPQTIPELPAGDLRVTWVDGEGRVLYDNETDPRSLPNHADRPEIRMALSEGTGETVRKSDTLNMNTFYYAKRLPGGTVLRLAAEARSMGSVFLAAAPVLLGIILVIFLGCLLLSHLLTAQLIAPIEDMAAHLDEPGRRPVYRELEPFANEIRAQHEKILSAAKSRQDFTANVSHELKTPLTAISGWGETLLSEQADPEETRRGIQIILRETRRLISMVEELLEFTRIQDGRFTLNVVQSDIRAEFEDTVFMYGSRLKQENIELVYLENDEEIPEIPCDTSRMRQVFLNILDNAAKHGGEGGKITAEMHCEDGFVVVRIRDFGPGIPEEELPLVKKKFYKGSSKARGSGIGLAVCEEIVTMHNGTLELANAEGGGTLVTIRLPIAGH